MLDQTQHKRLGALARGLFAGAALLVGAAAQAAAQVGEPAAEQPPLEEVLQRADAFRLNAEQARVRTRVRLYKGVSPDSGGELDKERLYDVLVSPGRRSLVLFRSRAEAGQKVLMLDDKFWLLLPGTRRPLRISAAQKLLGEASTGDVATLTWSEDYRAELLGEETVDGAPALRLSLQARSRGLSYQRIEALVHRDTHQPLRASMYLKSGKLAKEAEFVLGELDGQPRIVRMLLHDRIDKGRRTVVDYLEVRPEAIPDKLYNPAYLQRHPRID